MSPSTTPSVTNADFDRILAGRPLMAIFRGLGTTRSLELARTAWDLGIEVVELPIQSDADVDALAAVVAAGREEGRLVGAGTVVSTRHVELAASIPPVATNRAPGNGPAIARNQPAPSSDAGNALSHVSPSAMAACTSVAVATPGSDGIPAVADARTTSASKPGLTVNAAPADAASSTCRVDTTVPAPTSRPCSRPAATTAASASTSASDWIGSSTTSMPRSQAVRASSRLRVVPSPRKIAMSGRPARMRSNSALSIAVMGQPSRWDLGKSAVSPSTSTARSWPARSLWAGEAPSSHASR